MSELVYFKREEFRCPCCGGELMDERFLAKLDLARHYAKVPFLINSGWRCPKCNEKVGGKKGSEHTLGHGVDIATEASALRFQVVRGAILAGFKRIGIGATFVHLGDSKRHPQEVMWLY